MLDVFSSVGVLDARNGAPGEMCKSHQRLEAIAETLAHDAIFLRHWCHIYSPMLLLPNSLPPLVELICGGGVSSCEAVGARDWRIEYVRCILTNWLL